MTKYITAVEIDDDPQNPRDDDNMGTMICLHKRYVLGDEHDYKVGDYSGWNGLEADIVAAIGPAIVLPLFLYDHGGITISTRPFSCGFDSGQVGFIYITKERIRVEYNVARVTSRVQFLAENALRAEVEAYDYYITNNVWGYAISDALGNEYEACWGFMGEEAAREEAAQVVAALEKCDAERHQELIRVQAAMPCCFV